MALDDGTVKRLKKEAERAAAKARLADSILKERKRRFYEKQKQRLKENRKNFKRFF